MLRNVSLRAAGYIGHTLQASDLQIQLYAFSVEIALRILIQMSVYLLIAFMFGLLWQTLIVLLCLVAWRTTAGGAQFKIFPRCLIFSGMIIALLVFLSLTQWPSWLSYSLIPLMILAGIFAINKWVPGGYIKKFTRNSTQRSRQKFKTSILLLICTALCIFLEYYNFRLYSQGLVVGIIAGIFFLSPWGFGLMAFIDKSLDHFGREVQQC